LIEYVPEPHTYSQSISSSTSGIGGDGVL
jgi:hypothetical protein